MKATAAPTTGGARGYYHDGFTKPDYRRPRVSVECDRFGVTTDKIKVRTIELFEFPLTLSRASMAKSTVYGRWGLRHLNFVFICRMATTLRMKLRIELFFTVI